MKKVWILSIILLAIIIPLSISSFAHTTSQASILDSSIDPDGHVLIGSDTIGWIIDESMHLGSSTITYRFDSSVSEAQKTMFRNAASEWHDAFNSLTITEVTNNEFLYVTTCDFTNFPCAIMSGNTDSNGHLTSAVIAFNKGCSYHTANQSDMAHEIGHVIGLNDLHGTQNKLMYYFYTRTESEPSDVELWGVKILQNQHDTHEWLYTNSKKTCYYCGGEKTEQHHYVWSQYNYTYHKGTCSDCGAVVYERHYHYHNNLLGCLRCGYNGPIPQNVPEPELGE